jgi:hypothetical protein
MKKFLKNFAFFFGPIVLLLFGIILYFVIHLDVRYKDLPAPNLSASYSFNTKMEFIKNKQAKVVTIGSSMSLNNVGSDAIVKYLKTEAYLNFSSWGFNIQDVFYCLQFVNRNYKPKVLIMSVNLVDFIERDISKSIDYKGVEQYLSAKNSVNDFFERGYTPSYLIKEFDYGRIVKVNLGKRSLIKVTL